MIPGCPDCGEYRNARGRAPVDPNIFKQPGSLVLGVAGQSMLGNFAQLTPYNPWTGGVYELDTVTGNIYQVTDGSFPTMGMNGWFSGEVPGPIRLSVLPYWGDMLVANKKCARILLAAHNIGGITAQRMSPVGDMYARSSATLAWLKSLGIPPNYWVEIQGQGDVNPSDTTACSSAQNYADLRKWRWNALHSAGLTCTIVEGQGAHWTGYSDVYPDRYNMVKQGQILATQGISNVALGPDDDEWVPDSVYRVDGVHPNDNMRYWQMQRWLPAFPVF